MTDDSLLSETATLHALHAVLLASWNARDAATFAEQFTEDAHVIGFDGSEMSGRAEIESQLGRIFGDHPTRPYVGLVRDVKHLGDDVAVLHAVAGMYPPDQRRIDPAVNTVQTLVAIRCDDDRWRAVLYQNTPAALHGRPDQARALTEELQRELDATP